MTQKISVIIPTYNRESSIEAAVRSVINQTYSNLEIIIIDDGSTDNTEQIISNIQDDRITYHRQENGGASKARNTGVALATSDIIAFHDSDDIWRPEKLESQMNYWNEHPQYEFIYCGFVMHCNDGSVINAPVYQDGTKLSGNIFDTLLIKNMVGTPAMLMKKEVFEEVNGFDTSLPCFEDWDLALRIARNHQLGFVDKPLFDSFQTEGSVSTNIAASFSVRCLFISRYKQYLMEHNLFDKAVTVLFDAAGRAGVMDNVKQMLMIYLSK